jgi:DNA-binding response OmpR family regulator
MACRSHDGGVHRLLLIEDDPAIAEPLTRALVRDGYLVEAARDGPTGLQRALAGDYDLLVLDLGLPGLDGLEVCRRLRAALPTLPVLMLTAPTEELHAVVGFDAGADDYVTKPFRLAELLARVRARLRNRPVTVLEANGVRVDLAARRAWRENTELALTPKEFDLLAREAGKVVRRERIMEEVWGSPWYGSTKTLDMHVSWLRRKLGDDPANPRLLTTVRGVGLRLERR